MISKEAYKNIKQALQEGDVDRAELEAYHDAGKLFPEEDRAGVMRKVMEKFPELYDEMQEGKKTPKDRAAEAAGGQFDSLVEEATKKLQLAIEKSLKENEDAPPLDVIRGKATEIVLSSNAGRELFNKAYHGGRSYGR